jgi:hypothetical protein
MAQGSGVGQRWLEFSDYLPAGLETIFDRLLKATAHRGLTLVGTVSHPLYELAADRALGITRSIRCALRSSGSIGMAPPDETRTSRISERGIREDIFQRGPHTCMEGDATVGKPSCSASSGLATRTLDPGRQEGSVGPKAWCKEMAGLTYSYMGI